MYPHILHVYGPIWITTYGAMIILGICLFSFLMLRDPIVHKLIRRETFFDIMSTGIFAGIIGGRALYVLENWREFSNAWYEVFFPWIGGFSILGTIITVIAVLLRQLTR